MLPCSNLLSLIDDIVLVVSIVGRVVHANPPIDKMNVAVFIAPVVRLLVMEVVIPHAADTICRVQLGQVVQGLSIRKVQ